MHPGLAIAIFRPNAHTSRTILNSSRPEELITVYDKRGFSKKVWRKRPGKRNEALDLRAYAYTALCGLYASGLELNKEADRLMQIQKAPPKPVSPNLNQAPPVGGVFNSGIGPAGLSVPAADPYL